MRPSALAFVLAMFFCLGMIAAGWWQSVWAPPPSEFGPHPFLSMQRHLDQSLGPAANRLLQFSLLVLLLQSLLVYSVHRYFRPLSVARGILFPVILLLAGFVFAALLVGLASLLATPAVKRYPYLFFAAGHFFAGLLLLVLALRWKYEATAQEGGQEGNS